MLVKVKKQNFDSSGDASIIWICIGPTMEQVRGKSFLVKMEALSHLSPSQRALFLFQVIYGHSAKGVLGLLSHISYLLSIPGVWAELKHGIRYFGEGDMTTLLDEMEELYITLRESYGSTDAGWLNLQNPEMDPDIQAAIKRIDEKMNIVIPEAVKQIGAYIRNHPEEYVEYIDMT